MSLEWRADVLCVELAGCLAHATVDRFDRKVYAAISDAGHSVRAVVVDCEKLDRVSGIGWHHILLLRRSLYDLGAALRVASLPPYLQDIFGNVKFRGSMSVHRTMAEAMESLR